MWLRNHHGRRVTHYKIGVYLRDVSVETAANGVKKLDSFPLNEIVFRERDFVIQ
jgi:hypothetical protein